MFRAELVEAGLDIYVIKGVQDLGGPRPIAHSHGRVIVEDQPPDAHCFLIDLRDGFCHAHGKARHAFKSSGIEPVRASWFTALTCLAISLSSRPFRWRAAAFQSLVLTSARNAAMISSRVLTGAAFCRWTSGAGICSCWTT